MSKRSSVYGLFNVSNRDWNAHEIYKIYYMMYEIIIDIFCKQSDQYVQALVHCWHQKTLDCIFDTLFKWYL